MIESVLIANLVPYPEINNFIRYAYKGYFVFSTGVVSTVEALERKVPKAVHVLVLVVEEGQVEGLLRDTKLNPGVGFIIEETKKVFVTDNLLSQGFDQSESFPNPPKIRRKS